ncbi:hypothetical protein [Pseudalkalibacillus berkeleyi]|uniref:Beta-lactamase inhibitor (BLIP) n=1 Tax=Pseudalkalibacillus berkeleyi TaxID=1069813 RepID=A0ABS9GYG3_9BACL|nr:hypothetical protein [Pseudalkalibacillus berkeleyi]MCF6137779.1 hypothetical protein [Pseudalkalibacillus berkeleyi]
MRLKSNISFILIGSIFLMGGCNLYQSNNIPIEMVAFNSLTKEEVNKIPVSPKDSVVNEVIVSEDLGKQIGDKFIGKTIYSVTFNNTEDDTNGRLIVYVSNDKETVIGKGYENRK